ncbi:TPA: hypothetical protein ACF5K2_004780 [Salmonella enterica]
MGRLLRTENEHGQRTFSYNQLDQITAVTLTPTEAGQHSTGCRPTRCVLSMTAAAG